MFLIFNILAWEHERKGGQGCPRAVSIRNIDELFVNGQWINAKKALGVNFRCERPCCYYRATRGGIHNKKYDECSCTCCTHVVWLFSYVNNKKKLYALLGSAICSIYTTRIPGMTLVVTRYTSSLQLCFACASASGRWTNMRAKPSACGGPVNYKLRRIYERLNKAPDIASRRPVIEKTPRTFHHPR